MYLLVGAMMGDAVSVCTSTASSDKKNTTVKIRPNRILVVVYTMLK